MIKRTLLAAVVVLSLAGIAPPPASAAPVTCPLTIMHNTTLHQDLDCTGVTTGIAVLFGAPGKTLDLNGHSINGHVGSDSAYGVYSRWNNDTIKNGTVQNFYWNVYFNGSSNSRVTRLKVIGDPADASSEGLYFEYGAGNLVRHVKVTGEVYGIDFEYGADNRIIQNVVDQSIYSFYTYEETGSLFKSNRSHGIAGTTDGFYDNDYSNFMRYVGNTVDNGKYGFYLSCDYSGVPKVLSGNVATQNSKDGFYLYECYNEYDYHQGGTLFRHNTSNNNGASGFYTSNNWNSTWLGNTANNNGDYGFNLDYPSNDVIIGNVSNGNQDDTGFWLEDNYSYYQVRTFSHNVANNNLKYGLYADYSAPGHGNHAHGNPTMNCDGVAC